VIYLRYKVKKMPPPFISKLICFKCTSNLFRIETPPDISKTLQQCGARHISSTSEHEFLDIFAHIFDFFAWREIYYVTGSTEQCPPIHINTHSKEHTIQACHEHLFYLISLSLVHLEIILPTYKKQENKKQQYIDNARMMKREGMLVLFTNVTYALSR
jgi:hypothetical protein